MRRRRSAQERIAIAAARGWVCAICDREVRSTRDSWALDHVIPLADGGADEVDNLTVVHTRCHVDKTKADLARIAKGKRRQATVHGAKTPSPRPMPGSKRSRHKRVYDRETGQWVTIERT
jgi:5-methylcytosine-specific restriction endonuclease McrA